MSDCELLKTCIFFNDKMANIPSTVEIFKMKYCRSDKGKAHKKYEFGCKVSLVSTSKDSWVVGVQAIHGSPYDGHTLEGALGRLPRFGSVA